MKYNTKRSPNSHLTHEGGKAKHISVNQQLERSVMSCLLWEREFYESGVKIADRIISLAQQCNPTFVAELAVRARTEFKLRHVPLLLLLSLVRHNGGKITEDAIYNVIRRPDELNELLAMYFAGSKKPLSNSLKRGLRRAFTRFDEYQLAKWNRPAVVTLRDVMRLVRPKAKDKKQNEAFKKLATKSLTPPNTWESRMAGGENKKKVFESLMNSNELGYMALLRNLRGMLEAGVDVSLIKKRLATPSDYILPYRFIAAARYAPSLEPELDAAMMQLMKRAEPLRGKTVLVVDVSGSMDSSLSQKSDLKRIDAACGLAILLSGMCDDIDIYTFSRKVKQVPPRKGMALRDAIINSQAHLGTFLGGAMGEIDNGRYDRLIVITDEQCNDIVPDPKGSGWMLNVASNQNGVGYGAWNHIDGFSEACVRYIQETERSSLY